MKLCLFDGPNRSDFLPLVYTRPVAELFIGAMTFADRWSRVLDATVVVETEAYLQSETPDFDLAILASCLPNPSLLMVLKNLESGQKIEVDGQLIAFKGATSSTDPALDNFSVVAVEAPPVVLRYPWDLFSHNTQAIKEDAVFFNSTHTQSIDASNTQLGTDPVMVGKDVRAAAVVFNTSDGPIILDDGATIMEGSLLRGPLYIGKNTVVKMGTKMYGGSSLGPNSKVGGELNNVVFIGNSNKGHDGFLGNAVVGEWCNLGAATDASNLKNDYGITRAWNYTQQTFIPTGLQFCGLIMGDHSKTAIQTAINTATVIGVGCNIFSVGFPRTFIPSFSRGGSQGMTVNRLDKVIETVQLVMKRRNKSLEQQQESVLKHIFSETKPYRTSFT